MAFLRDPKAYADWLDWQGLPDNENSLDHYDRATHYPDAVQRIDEITYNGLIDVADLPVPEVPEPLIEEPEPERQVGNVQVQLFDFTTDDTQGAAGFTWNQVTGYVDPGCAQHVADGNSYTIYFPTIPATEGRVLDFEFFVSYTGVVNNPGTGIGLAVLEDDGWGNAVRTFHEPTGTDSDWVRVYARVVTPAGLSTVRFVPFVSADVSAGTFYLDDFSVVEP